MCRQSAGKLSSIVVSVEDASGVGGDGKQGDETMEVTKHEGDGTHGVVIGDGKEVDGVMEHDGGRGSKDGTSGVISDGKKVDDVMEHEGGGGGDGKKVDEVMEHEGGGGSKDGTSGVGDGKQVDEVMEHDGDGGSKDGISGVGDRKQVDEVMEHDVGVVVSDGQQHANQTKEVIEHEGGAPSAVGDEKQENKTKEVMEDDGSGSGSGSGHDCFGNVLDVVDDGKQVQTVDTVMIVEDSNSHSNIDTTGELKNGGGSEGQAAATLDAGGDKNIRNGEPEGEEVIIEGANPVDNVVSVVVLDGGSGGVQVPEIDPVTNLEDHTEQGKQAAIEEDGDGSGVVIANVVEDQDRNGKKPMEYIASSTVHGETKEPGTSNIVPISGGVEEQVNQADPLTSPEAILPLAIHHEGSIGSSEPSMQQANHALRVSGTNNIPSEEGHEVPVVHRPMRILRLFGVDIEVPEPEVQPPTPAVGSGTGWRLTNQESSNGRGSSTQRPKYGFRLMGFDL